jgi:hypothetical protein
MVQMWWNCAPFASFSSSDVGKLHFAVHGGQSALERQPRKALKGASKGAAA